ncbi:MAG: HU family DNA-binding protein [Actinobacteria bacterium]|nr:HU family DNA-binding protein [Actinomycetota bacterium]
MNKAELIEVLTEKLNVDRKQANDAVEELISAIVRAVHKGESVTITGFGVFERRRRAARVARNPRTGETVKVKPTSVPAFRPGAQFKAIVSGAQKLPTEGPAVKRGAVGGAVRKAAVKKAVKKAVVKKVAAKKVAAKKAPAVKKVVAKKAPVKKAPVKKAVVKKAAVKKVVAKKAPVRKAVVKKAPAKKAPVKKAVVKKAAVKKVVAKKAPAKKGRR